MISKLIASQRLSDEMIETAIRETNGEAPCMRADVLGAGAPSGGASMRSPGYEHDLFCQALDLNPAHECGPRVREDRLVVLGLGGVGVVVEGSGVRVRLELRESVRSW